jgi:hypothetical protein
MMTGIVQQLGVDRYNAKKPERVRISLETKLRIMKRPDIEISLHNISSRGFMAECGVELEIGTDALLFLPGIGWTLANIRWRRGDRFGARFSEAINMRQFWRANPPMRGAHRGEASQAA